MNSPNSFRNTLKSPKVAAVAKTQRSYTKVSDEQRVAFIDLLSQNDHISIAEAADLFQMNYESAKSIWNIFKLQGRKHNIKNKAKFRSSAVEGEDC